MTARKRVRTERETALQRVETEGLRAAVEALIDVCNDKKAPAPARATSATTLARISALGGFGKNYSPDPFEKELHEMTHAEVQAQLRRFEEEDAMRDASGDADPDDEPEADEDGGEDDVNAFD